MSTPTSARRRTSLDIAALKGQRPIVSLTAHSAPVASLLDPHVDFILVGDSLGMVVYGLPSTLGVTMEMMIAHGQAVMRGSSTACVVVDLPFGAYQESKEQAFRNAARLLKETGCSAVKLEGGADMAETVAFLTKRGVPVLGHIGLMPQMVNTAGGYRSTGWSDDQAAAVRSDALAIQDAGAFAVVVEGTVEALAREITGLLRIPTIGIGASAACDGQILVTDDMLGIFTEFKPRFVKHFAQLAPTMSEAFAAYASEVKARQFPGDEHVFQRRPGGKESKA